VKRARSEVLLDYSKDGKLDLSLFRMDSNLSPPPDEGNHGGSDSELPVAESGRMVEGEREEDENNSGAGAGTPGSIEDKQKKKKPKRGGRPKADVWELYTTYGERNERTRRFLVTCNACGAIIDGRVEGMERHIGYDCQRIPEPEKLKWQERVVEKVKLIKEEAMNYAATAAAAGVGAGALVLKGSSVKRPKKIKRGEGITSEDDAVERFREYLRIPTARPDPDYSHAVRFLLKQAYSIGLEGQSLEFVKKKPVVVLTWKGENPFLQSVLLNSHMDVVTVDKEKWNYDPFLAYMDESGDIFARGAQYTKCLGMQYLEAIRNLRDQGFVPLRSVYITFVPDEEVGGGDVFQRLITSTEFQALNVGVAVIEGESSDNSNYRVFHGERTPWSLVIKALGDSGLGSKLYEQSAIESLVKSMEAISRFRASQFDLLKAGLKPEGGIVTVNPVYLKAGSPSHTVFVRNMQPPEAEAGFDVWVPPFTDMPAFERRIAEEWAPSCRNLTYKFEQKGNLYGQALVTPVDSSNHWWGLLEDAVSKVDGKLSPPEISPSATDGRFIRAAGWPAFGFSPISNTPILLHEHNEFINAREFLKGISVYEQIIKAFSSFTGVIEGP